MASKKTATKVVAAGAAGAAAGVLFAPRKGKITRAQMKNAYEQKKEAAQEKALHAKDEAMKLKKKAEEKMPKRD